MKIFSVLAEFVLWEFSIVSSLSWYSILVQNVCNDRAWLTSECSPRYDNLGLYKQHYSWVRIRIVLLNVFKQDDLLVNRNGRWEKPMNHWFRLNFQPSNCSFTTWLRPCHGVYVHVLTVLLNTGATSVIIKPSPCLKKRKNLHGYTSLVFWKKLR